MDTLGVNPEVKSIHLPSIVLEQIFGYMSHTEKLISRLACKSWNNQISRVLAKSSYFVLTSRVSNEAMLDSNVEWTGIKIDNGPSTLPQVFKDIIGTLQLDMSGFSHADKMAWKNLLIGFPNLMSLDLMDLSIDKETHEFKETKDQGLEDKFHGILRGLKNLSLTFPFFHYDILNRYLMEFSTPGVLCLNKFTIKEIWSSNPKYTYSSAEQVDNILSYIHGIISSSSSTLTYLDLDFDSHRIGDELIPGLVSKLCSLEDLKLQSLLIQHVPSEEYVERDYKILLEFLKRQLEAGDSGVRRIKDVFLPWCEDLDTAFCQELVRLLPQDIEFVGGVCKEYISPEFPGSGYGKLKSISIGADITMNMSIEQCGRIQKLQVHSRKCSNILEHGTCSFTSKPMSNLTELKIFSIEEDPLLDSDLHVITSSLNKLRILHIESSGISDFGVMGLENTHPRVQELVRTKSLYVDGIIFPEKDVFQNEKALSSLKMLEKLILIGNGITDVGIAVGLRFGSQLKQLVIGSESDEVSDLGLNCLGVNNSSLESFEGSFKSSKISKLGIENMKKRLPMIEFTRKFKILNQVPSSPRTCAFWK